MPPGSRALGGTHQPTSTGLLSLPPPPKPGTHSLPEAEPSLFQGQGPGDHSQNPWGSSQGSGCWRKQLSTKLPAPELRPRPPGDASPYPLVFHQMTLGARPSITHVPSVHTPGCSCQLHTSPNPLWGSLPPASHTPCASAAIEVVLVRGGALVANRRPQEAAWTMLFLLLSYWLAVASVVCKLVEHPPTQALGYPGGLTRGWGGGGIPQRPASASAGPQRCFLVVQEPGPSVASSSFRKPNCSFIF